MGKWRLRLQSIMPNVWYRRLKTELGRRAGAVGQQSPALNYKRWVSQRKQLAISSKRLLFLASSSVNICSNTASASKDEGQATKMSTWCHRESSINDGPSVTSNEERQIDNHTGAASFVAPTEEMFHRTAQIHDIKAAEAVKQADCKLTSQGVDCTLNVSQSPQQTRSLLSPDPVPNSSFQLNVQELNTKLKALSYEERRTYGASPLLAVAGTLSPVNYKLDLESMVESSPDPGAGRLTAKKLFPEEIKILRNEPCSSYGSASCFTAQSHTSSEDTAFTAKASTSSLWEKDLSSLPSEGSELYGAEENSSVRCMKRRSRRARQDEFTRQRSRMNETRMNFLWGLDEVNHVSDSLSCDEGIYQRERLLQNVYLLQNLKDDVPGPTARFRSPYTLETRSLRSYNPDSHLEKRQEGDRYIKHRRSVSNESLFLESTAIRSGMSKFSPLQNLDIYDDLNLSQCSDSAFSDTELETDSKHVNGTTRATLKEMDKQIRQSPMTNIRLRHYAASPLYDKPSGQLRSPSRCASVYLDRSPALSRSKSTSDSCACSLDHGINCSDRIHLDRNTPCSVITRNRSRSRWRPSCRSHDIIKSLLLKNMKLEVNPGSKTVVTPSRMQSQICQRDAQCKGCAERMKAWELLSPKSACKSKISKRNDNFSLDGDDYDGDVSFRSLNEPPTATFSERNTTTMDYESPYNSIEATVCRSLSAVNGTAYLQQNLLSPMQPTMTAMRRSIDDPEDEVDCASPVMINIPASYKLNKRIAGDEQMEGNTLKAQQQGPLDASSRSEDVSTHDGKPGTFESFKDMECIPSWMKKQLVHRDTACFPPSMSRSCSGREASDAMMESSRSTPTKARVEKHEVTEGGDKGNDYESFAMVKSTTNPGQDFKESMMEMVLHKRLHDSFQLVELLQCYLSLNSAVYHDVIVKAFIELWSELFNPDK